MPLDRKYPESFTRLWQAYPKWPKGRSVKALAYKAFEKANRELQFTESDIQAILDNFELRKRTDAKWQDDSPYGPPALQVFINQRRWNDEFEEYRPKRSKPAVASTFDERPMWQQQGYASEAEYEARRVQGITPEIEAMLRKTGLRRRR